MEEDLNLISGHLYPPRGESAGRSDRDSGPKWGVYIASRTMVSSKLAHVLYEWFVIQ